MRTLVHAMLLMPAALLWATGCIPATPQSTPAPGLTTPAPGPATPAAQPATAGPAPVPTQLSTQQDPETGAKKSTAKLQVLDQTPGTGRGTAMITVRPEPDGSYTVSGGDGIKGVIKPQVAGSDSWVFDGTITFPLTGYTVGEPFAANLGASPNMPAGAIAPSPDGREAPMTTLTIPFKYPPNVQQAEATPQTTPLHFTFKAPAKTGFVVYLMPSL